jgi:hypothetical protein
MDEFLNCFLTVESSRPVRKAVPSLTAAVDWTVLSKRKTSFRDFCLTIPSHLLSLEVARTFYYYVISYVARGKRPALLLTQPQELLRDCLSLQSYPASRRHCDVHSFASLGLRVTCSPSAFPGASLRCNLLSHRVKNPHRGTRYECAGAV